MFDLVFPWLSSDAAHLAVWGGLAALVAAYANWADRRQTRRTDLDAVGLVPWTPVYMAAMLVALALLGLAVQAWLATPA